jgi:EmrB/QacA subfamily drug resistance transporter
MSPTTAPARRFNAPPLVPIVLAVSLFMENMDSTVIATSLAAVATDIHTDPIALKLALTAYLVALAIFIPISAWAADRWGARNVFRSAIVVFIAGSIACAASDSLLTFVLARLLQGLGGAMMTPVARLVLVRITPRSQLVGAMAWLSIPGLIGPIVGPPIGGFITTYFSWHWIFLINVPIGILGVGLVTWLLPDWKRNEARRMDFSGFFLTGTAFAGWVFGLSVLTLPALPIVYGLIALVVGTICWVFYLGHAKKTEYPILDLRLFRFPLFRTTVVAGTFFRLGTGAMPFLFPLMLQLAFGLNPFQSGMITFSTAIGAFAAKFVSEPIIARLGFRAALVIATFVSVLGVVAMGCYSPETPMALMMGLLIITGFFQSVFWTGTNAFTFADIEDRDAGQATAISQVSVQLSLATGVAIGGGVLEGARQLHGGGTLVLGDFHIAFYCIAAIALVSTVMFYRLSKTAGSNLTTHRHAGEVAAE